MSGRKINNARDAPKLNIDVISPVNHNRPKDLATTATKKAKIKGGQIMLPIKDRRMSSSMLNKVIRDCDGGSSARSHNSRISSAHSANSHLGSG